MNTYGYAVHDGKYYAVQYQGDAPLQCIGPIDGWQVDCDPSGYNWAEDGQEPFPGARKLTRAECVKIAEESE